MEVTLDDVQPMDDRLLVEQDPAEEITASGLHIPQSVEERRGSVRGVVLAAGPGRLTDEGVRIPMDVGVGDHVVYSRYSGVKVTIKHEEYVMMREDDVLARES